MSFFSGFIGRKKRAEKGVPSLDGARSKKKNALKNGEKHTFLVQDGVAILAAAGLMVFSAAARGVNLLLALGAFFVGFLVVDYFWGANSLKKLRVKRRLPDSIYAGEPFYVEVELDGTERRAPSWAVVAEDEWEPEDPRFDVPESLKTTSEENAATNESEGSSAGNRGKNKKKRRASKKTSDKKETGSSQDDSDLHVPAAVVNGASTIKPVVYFPTIKPGEKRREYYVGVMTRRGRRQLSALTISTRFPCGFYRSSVRIAAPDEVLVLPRMGRLTSVWDAYAGRLTQETSVATGQTSRAPDETVAIRDWRPGDSSRMIAWRASAKRNRLQSREFARRQTRTIVIVLDLYAPQSSPERHETSDPELWKRIEKAVSFTATLVEEWSTADSRLVFALNGDEAGVDQKERDVNDEWREIVGGGSVLPVMSRLALAVETHTDRLQELLDSVRVHSPHDAQVVVVSIGSKRESLESLSDKKTEDAGYVSGFDASLGADNVSFIDASSDSFDQYFELESDAD